MSDTLMNSIVIVGLGVLGLLIGSFLNVVVSRLPRGESVIRPRSHCPRCRTDIAPRDNIPIASWLLLGGRCRTCRLPIPVRYPLIEAATGLAWALAGLLAVAGTVPPALLPTLLVGSCGIIAATGLWIEVRGARIEPIPAMKEGRHAGMDPGR